MATLKYFAYGSNMLTERLRVRVPSALAVKVATLDGYRLDFAKASIDGSGKADVVHAQGSTVNGVLFAIDARELNALDRFEGHDYQRKLVPVLSEGSVLEATIYLAKAEKRVLSSVPYSWYLALVLAGATQHGLPHEFLERLRLTRFSVDPIPDRKSKVAALGVLNESGYRFLLDELEEVSNA